MDSRSRRLGGAFHQALDAAAGVLLAREAGARVTDLDGRNHPLTSTATIASASGVGAPLLDALMQDRLS